MLALDVVDEASRQAAVDAVVEAEGAVGVLVNNAGYSQSGAVESVPDERVRAQFETNVFAPLALSRLVLPGMREQGWGKMVNVSSMGGRFTFPGGGLYHASKYALEALSDAMRFELKGFGVDVILIEPGLIRTGFGAVVEREIGSATSGPTVRMRTSTRRSARPPSAPTRRACSPASAGRPRRSPRRSSARSTPGGRGPGIRSQRRPRRCWRSTRCCPTRGGTR